MRNISVQSTQSSRIHARERRRGEHIRPAPARPAGPARLGRPGRRFFANCHYVNNIDESPHIRRRHFRMSQDAHKREKQPDCGDLSRCSRR